MKIKSSTMDKVFVTCNTIFLVLFVTITLYPVLNTVALSFNDGIDAVRGGIHLWPRIFTLSNYKTFCISRTSSPVQWFRWPELCWEPSSPW